VSVGNGAPTGGSGTQYFIGQFDGKTFSTKFPKENTLWVDHGSDFYAPQSWNNEPNERRITIGWLNNWRYARDIPATEWRGSLSMIRELTLKNTEFGIRLIQTPIKEYQQIRGEHLHWQQKIIEPGVNLLEGVCYEQVEIDARFKLIDTTACFGIYIITAKDEYTTIKYMAAENQLIVDRTKSGQRDFHQTFATEHRAILYPEAGEIHLHVFIDSSSIEVFANDGLLTLSECIFPSSNSHEVKLFSEDGKTLLTSLDIFQLKSD